MKTYIAPRTDGIGLTDYYLKTDADKVIAELKQQIEFLQKEKKIIQDLYIGERNDCRIWASRAIHNKRKRCLAMALWCNACLYQFPSFGTPSKKEKWWSKWHDKWLDIAEKYK